MGGTVGRFDYRAVGGAGERPSAALGWITLKAHTRLQDGVIALTPQMTALEVDANVEELKRDLDAAAARLKAALARK